jgi:hypothetical protein
VKPNELIGKPEGPLLEFKKAEVLDEKGSIAEAVVAMLNASNGTDAAEIWIGVDERESRAVALPGVPDAHSRRAQLRNVLLDTIEPSPTNEELELVVETFDERTSLIRISVKAPAWRKPFAALSRDRRTYVVRQQDSSRRIGYEELREHFRGARPEDDQEAKARDSVRQWVSHSTEKTLLHGCLRVALAPHPELSPPLSDQERLAFLTQPALSGNRAHGHAFVGRIEDSTTKADATEVRISSAGFDRVSMLAVGRLFGVRTLQSLRDPAATELRGPSPIHALALCESVTSMLRLARAAERGEARRWFGAVSVLRPSGWVLTPADPLERDVWLKSRRYNASSGSESLVPEPVRFERGEVASNPDACAYRMLVRLYDHFGLTEEHLPREFDPRTRRLVID